MLRGSQGSRGSADIYMISIDMMSVPTLRLHGTGPRYVMVAKDHPRGRGSRHSSPRPPMPVARRYLDLLRAGSAICPFRQNRRPSRHVLVRRKTT